MKLINYFESIYPKCYYSLFVCLFLKKNSNNINDNDNSNNINDNDNSSKKR